jgi:serine/threonine protein kinase/tetratricopeptide (TPR) repeat protein
VEPERWQKIESIYHAAFEMAPADREAFLEEACDGDESLRHEVLSLLAASSATEEFLNAPALHVAARVLASAVANGQTTLTPALPEFIGRYRVLRLLGEGGMGLVVLAEQTAPVRRQVALKLISAGVYQGSVLQRFRSEQQSLAVMNHPAIAKVFDAGTTPEGQPYFVMEFVDGPSITNYCDAKKLKICDRLELFIKVCEGVQHAHQKAIIHRDLKPSNVLIAEIDGRPVPRIIDFGIAKAISPELAAEHTLLTQSGSLIGTPGYMSPEQAAGVADVDGRADVYSLGVILFVLLTGTLPFDTAKWSTWPLDEVLRQIREDDPPSPSTKLDRNQDTTTTAAEQRSTVPQELTRNLRGDLDWITLKAVNKDRTNRYSTPAELAADIQRYLNNEPILARPASTVYRIRKYVRRHRFAVAISAISMILLTSLFVAGYSTWRLYWRAHEPKLTEKDTLILTDFDNRTGDPVFDDALKQALAVELGQSPFLNIISDRRVSETLRMMGRPANERITMDIGQELCLRTGSKALLGGTISRLGGHYLLDLNALACNTGDTLAKEQGEARSKEDVLKTLSRISSSLRSKLGESLPSVHKFNVPIEATTSSLEALRNFSMGIKVWYQQGDAPSIPFFKQAIQLDPDFPMAYAMLSSIYGNLLQPSVQLGYATKAYQLRDRVTERERLRITEFYFRATGELDKEVETCELWAADYPRDAAPHGLLGQLYHNTGQYEKALAEYQEFLRLAPNAVVSYSGLGVGYLFLNRVDEAKGVFDRALARGLDSGNLHQQIYALAFLRGDVGQMEQQVAWSAGKPGVEDILLSMQSDTEAYYGRMTKARDYSRRAMDSAVRSDSKEKAALWQVNAALREAELGNDSTARRAVAKALALSPGRDVKLIAALTLARAGDASRAEALSKEMEKTYPTNTLMKLYWLPSLKAAIAVSKNKPSRALLGLEPTATYELGLADGYINYLYPVYLRGQAYLLAHNGTAAAAEFQKLLDHPGIVQNFVTGALAHLQIGRAYSLSGDTTKAKVAYQTFLNLWKGGDPDIPILKQAKAEFAELR